MQFQILPISLPPSSSSSSSQPPMVLESQPQHVLQLLSSSSSSEDEKNINERTPIIYRASSYSNISSKSSEQRRRKVASETSLHSLSSQSSVREEVEHAEMYFISRLSFKLLRYLGLGYRWITRFFALSCYAVLLMPGFLQVGFYYYTSSQVRRSIVYGDQRRNRLDLYLPKSSDGPKAVVAFVTGGAWVIGYKAWGALLGQQLAERDVIVACIDYRNFPQATIGDMVTDASQGISFVCNNIAEYGGDPNRIYVMGQSAGAHIAACALLEQAIKESGEGESTSWSVSQIKAYFGLSGGYNLCNLVDHFDRRGLYRPIFLSIMEGEESLRRFSPEVRVQEPNMRNIVSLLPPIILFHGTADYSIPSDASKDFTNVLKRVGAQSELILYEGKTHTDLFVQDPMRGGPNDLITDIVAFIYADDSVALAKAAVASLGRRLVPEFMIKLARKISPF
ncbi:hypothetical protein GIB67_041922 [Kingdonia uniflora]|uniref:protein-S-isoprenylcysteine alpha-carbonyl methylesterase n=1 Tax=Kingdonia uniflora TaxID=39325 RepID=A0A7J7N1R2_9MAGN|nr:hypothetical protein GIB67_041922 [Kingdonia uniflora]